MRPNHYDYFAFTPHLRPGAQHATPLQAKISDEDQEKFTTIKRQILNLMGGNGSASDLYSIGGLYLFVSILMFLVFAAMSIVLIFTHLSFVHVHTKCTNFDFPADCWKGSRLRAMNFTAPTTSLTYASSAWQINYGVDDDLQWKTLYSYDVLVNRDPTTLNHSSALCTATYGAKQTNAITACEASSVRPVYQIPNHIGHMTLSGGVHIIFLIWVAVHVAASFSLILVPTTERTTSGKKWLLFIWHSFGLLFTLTLYANDSWFNMRIPPNNVFLSIAIQLFAIFVQYSWTVLGESERAPSKQITQETQTEPMQTEEEETQTESDGSMRTAAGSYALASAMRIGGSAAPLRTTKLAAGPYNYATKNANGRYDDVQNDWNPLLTKLERVEPLEPLLMQCAVTVPLLVIAVMCIGHKVQMDYLLQTVFMRITLIFSTLAVSERISAIARRDYTGSLDVSEATVGVQLTLAAAVLVMYITTIYDWFHPFSVTNADMGAGDLQGSQTVMIMTTLFVSVIIGAAIAYKIILQLNGPRSVVDIKLSFGFLITLQIALLLLFLVVLSYALTPQWWYGAYNKKDVLLNYS